MANCAIVGINWGDEGKGRMVDYLTNHYDIVVRYQGGGNAGHTVVNDKGTFALHLLPSGIFREGVVNILGNGVALDCENLLDEMNKLRAAGVNLSAMTAPPSVGTDPLVPAIAAAAAAPLSVPEFRPVRASLQSAFFFRTVKSEAAQSAASFPPGCYPIRPAPASATPCSSFRYRPAN